MMDQDLVIAVRRGEVNAQEIQRTELATIQIVEKLDLFERKKKPKRRRKRKSRLPCCATCDRYSNGCKGCEHYIPRKEKG